MSMHIYAFGSICRGEIDLGSDVDLLACVDGPAEQIDHEKYSVYRYERIQALWQEGNPFAWHLHLESKLLFSPDGTDFLSDLGKPARYIADVGDCTKFQKLFDRSYQELRQSSNSATFHLSCMFLAIRNFATCHSLSLGHPIFSRKSPLMVQPSLDIDPQAFSILTRARLLSTRGFGENITYEEVATATKAVAIVPRWMKALRSQHSP
ncbi:nucleotidyltransferase domain-containing protein [Pseudomonas corrugata]|uniref:nucleotidyltransferase domain-containing protein n=1 Tax=Pseudomonas corrugata TaxID=47879 RepID=UPI00222EB07F|nr:nucleotidyltransferase domain-containing protein [Pseudomonas corrugata]UZD97637.1 nucleotidyltransferase domain-containing protein [Pseudomonas corrugata]